MEEKRQYSLSGYGNKEGYESKLRYESKGAILTLDAALAVIVVTIIILMAAFYSAKSSDSLSNLQTLRTGSDIMAVLDNNGALATLDHEEILQEINSVLPSYYNMRVIINGTFPESPVIVETSSDAPDEGSFIGSGRRFLVIGSSFATAEYWVWSE